MKRILLFILMLSAGVLGAQEFQAISTGAGYSLQSFIDLQDGVEFPVPDDSWDIAFSASGQGFGIFVNESAGSGMTAAPAVALYNAMTTDFSEMPDTAVAFQNRLYNGNESWAEGAFNQPAAEGDPFDLGWGKYNPQTNIVSGTNVFILDLRGNGFKKIKIGSLSSGLYEFTLADLDGSNEQTYTIDKRDHTDELLVYFSVALGQTVAVEPQSGFDMLYTRYTQFLDNPEGGDQIPYLLTGILSGPGVQVAQADSIDTETVQFEDYRSDLSDELTIIGHDWKNFDLNTFEWRIIEDRVYFLKTADDHLWKIEFIDFEGSSTGTAVFEKTDLGVLSSTSIPDAVVETFDVYPNPASTHVDVAFTVPQGSAGKSVALTLFDMTGKVILRTNEVDERGLVVKTIDVSQLNQGMYIVALTTEGQTISRKVSVLR